MTTSLILQDIQDTLNLFTGGSLSSIFESTEHSYDDDDVSIRKPASLRLGDDDDDETVLTSASSVFTTDCAFSTDTSSSPASSTITIKSSREHKAIDSFFEKMQDIFRFLQSAGVASDSLCELKEQLFQKDETSVVLERAQEYMTMCSCFTDSDLSKRMETLELLEGATQSCVLLLTLRHKQLFRQLQLKKSMVVTDGSEVQRVQEQVCILAEQVTESQTRLYKVQTVKRRLARQLIAKQEKETKTLEDGTSTQSS